ncbi:hypothetical protein M5_0179 [Lysinibacillus phage vB_LfM_LysYB2]|nr:hypothetical protein M5_0179 [Lysinibacillus phage vB_LfM_LysYB2]
MNIWTVDVDRVFFLDIKLGKREVDVKKRRGYDVRVGDRLILREYMQSYVLNAKPVYTGVKQWAEVLHIERHADHRRWIVCQIKLIEPELEPCSCGSGEMVRADQVYGQCYDMNWASTRENWDED